MTTELVLLLGLFVFILGGAFIKQGGPRQVFQESAPRLGGRVERHITIGHRFNFRDNSPIQWAKPSGAAPTGSP